MAQRSKEFISIHLKQNPPRLSSTNFTKGGKTYFPYLIGYPSYTLLFHDAVKYRFVLTKFYKSSHTAITAEEVPIRR